MTNPAAGDVAAFTPPALTAEELETATRMAVQMTSMRSMPDVRKAVIFVICQNMTLLKEINEHRVARGLPPLPAYQPKV